MPVRTPALSASWMRIGGTMSMSFRWVLGLAVLVAGCAPGPSMPGSAPPPTPAPEPDAVTAARTTAHATEEDDLPREPVARLQSLLDRGAESLVHDDQRGYLESLLEALDIPVSSQTLVFSRTSLQTDRISPWTPRALYFNDDVYVGWVQESPILELASVDPDSGAVFYTLSQAPSDAPRFQRETTTCLMCHESRVTRGVPGFIVRSVLTDRHGYVITSIHEGATTDRTDFEERWGGWYVTGTHGGAVHSGNTPAPLLFDEVLDPRTYVEEVDFSGAQEVLELEGRFDPEPYLTPHSDIVALMVLGHQARVHNQITYALRETSEALADQELVFRATGEQSEDMLPSTRVRIDNAAEALLRDLLFVDEVALSGRVDGTSPFVSEFEALGPRDSRGRSLRDFDLERRLFRYPLSFLVYSDSFTELPAVLEEAIYRRLRQVLEGRDETEDFTHLSEQDRIAIREILEDTLPDYGAHR